MSLDRNIIEVLIYCILVGVPPSKISNNFLLKQTDGEVFHPFDINHINRKVVKSLRDSLNSYRTKPLGGRSKFIPLKRGWKIESVLRPKSHCNFTLPSFTEEHYNSQFYLPDTASTATPATSTSSSSATNNPTNMSDELPPPTCGPTPASINQNVTVDGKEVDYSLAVVLNSKNFFAITGPWGILGAYFPRVFMQSGKLCDAFLVFFKAGNKLDMFANAEFVCSVCDDKKGLILKQKDGINPDFMGMMSDIIVGDPERFGEDTGQATKFCKAVERNLKKLNASLEVYSLHLWFMNLGFSLTPGTYQFQDTTAIHDKGLSAAVLELSNGEDGYLLMVGIEDEEGKDDLESDEEEVDVKAEARRKARERTERKSNGGTPAGRFSSDDSGVDDITGRFAGINVGHGYGDTPSTTKTPRPSPRQMYFGLFKLINKEFASCTPADATLRANIAAICNSLLDENPDINEDTLYIEAIQEMIENQDHYSNTFGGDFLNNPHAQIAALASARRMLVLLYDIDDYEGGPALPKPCEYDSYNHSKTSTILYILKAGDNYYSLMPYPTDDPDDSSIDSGESGCGSPPPSPSEEEEKKAPSSIEKIKNYFGIGSTDKKESSARKKDAAPTPEILLTPLHPRTKSTKNNSAKKNLLNHLGDDTASTATTVQAGSEKKQKKEANPRAHPPPPPRRSARTRASAKKN